MVNLASDITPEELQVFLQDTDEQLQLLDDDIIKLENEGDEEELLQEIFRAAHTIKGSSAMLGYDTMAELTHSMENILDKLRHGELFVTTEIADALLNALDDLRILRENLTSSEETEIDVTSAIERLDALANTTGTASKKSAGKDENNNAVPLDEEGRKRLEESLATGQRIYSIGIDVEEGSPWAAVRFFQAFNELGDKGAIIGAKPSMEDIEAEKVEYNLEMVFASSAEDSEIKEVISAIPDVQEVRVEPYDPTLLEDGGNVPEAEATVEDIVSAVKEEASKPSAQKTGSQEGVKVSETVRIDVDRLDSLMNQIGELAVARSAFTRLSSVLSTRYRDDDDILALSKTLTNIDKVVDDLQLDITEARMMPVGTVFNRFPRLIRDLAHNIGKQVDFIVEGQETGIDRSVIEHIRDPLVHLLRNAVDHGIEMPEVRKAAGKPAKATIYLTAAHEQSYIAIKVKDDGKGIDGASLKEKAVGKGIINAESASRMSDQEAVNLIFEAGFSTAEKITDVSGRGVGMDIVKQNIDALRGMISVETEVGKGSTFTLKLPLTLATIHGLLITSGGITYAIPLVSVYETLRITPSEIQRVTQKDVFRLRDRVIPLLYLNEVLKVNRVENNDEKMNVAVVKAGDRMVGLVVDALKEPQEVVVKSMGTFIGEVRGIAGASILGTGDVALILDVPSLVKLVVMGE